MSLFGPDFRIGASALIILALGHGAKLIIVNYQGTHLDKRADVLIHADLAEVMPRVADKAINP